MGVKRITCHTMREHMLLLLSHLLLTLCHVIQSDGATYTLLLPSLVPTQGGGSILSNATLSLQHEGYLLGWREETQQAAGQPLQRPSSSLQSLQIWRALSQSTAQQYSLRALMGQKDTRTWQSFPLIAPFDRVGFHKETKPEMDAGCSRVSIGGQIKARRTRIGGQYSSDDADACERGAVSLTIRTNEMVGRCGDTPYSLECLRSWWRDVRCQPPSRALPRLPGHKLAVWSRMNNAEDIKKEMKQIKSGSQDDESEEANFSCHDDMGDDPESLWWLGEPLQGPPDETSQPNTTPVERRETETRQATMGTAMMGVLIALAILFLALVLIVIYWWCRKKKKQGHYYCDDTNKYQLS